MFWKRATPRLAGHDNRFRLGMWIGLIALLTYSLSPALSRSHVEGFSYLTETMSLLYPAISMADPLWDMGHSYFYLSRPGVIWLMAPLSDLAPGFGYNLLMWIMLPVFLAGVVILTRRWSDASWLASTTTLLFLPIVLDAQFFHNDNVVALGFSIWGLILLRPSSRLLTVFLAGCLLAIGVLCRLDQILLIPLFAMLACLSVPRPSSAFRRVGVGVAGFIFVHAIAAYIDPQVANVLQRIQTISSADALWARDGLPLNQVFIRDSASALFAFGAGLSAALFGASLMREKARLAKKESVFSWTRALPVLLLTYPLGIYALTFGKYYDPRAFLIIIPFVSPMVAIALDRVVLAPLEDKVSGKHRLGLANSLVLILILGPMLVPGLPPVSMPGVVPHETENAVPSLTGRIWYRDYWAHWQNGFHEDEARVNAMLTSSQTAEEPTVYLSTSWNLDRTLQRSLAVSEYQVAPPTNGACEDYVVHWQDNRGQSAYHMRLHVPFLPPVEEHTTAAFAAHGEACLRTFTQNRRFAVDDPFHNVSSSRAGATTARNADGVYPISDDAVAALSEAAEEMLTEMAAETNKTTTQVAASYLQKAEKILNGARPQ